MHIDPHQLLARAAARRADGRRTAAALGLFALIAVGLALAGVTPARPVLWVVAAVAAVAWLAAAEARARQLRRRALDLLIREGRRMHDGSQALERRIAALTSPAHCRELAGQLHRWATSPTRRHPGAPLTAWLPAARDAGVRRDMRVVADALAEAEQPPAPVVLRLREFLTEPESPLFGDEPQPARRELAAIHYLLEERKAA